MIYDTPALRPAIHLYLLAFCYYPQKADATAELDFVIQYDGLIIPVEVKSGSSGTLRPLHLFMDAAPHHFAVRLYNGKIKVDKITTQYGGIGNRILLDKFRLKI